MKFLIFIFIFATNPAFTTEISSDLKKGDEFYAGRSDIDKAYQALALYEKHLNNFPNDVEGLWRASMANYYIGHLLKKVRKRKEYYKKGIKQGQACVEQSHEKLAKCYFWQATNTALLKKEYGIFSLAFGIGGIIDLYERSLQLNPNYAGGGAYRMLSLLYFKAPGFLGGDVGKAYRYIKEAIKIAPNEPLNYYFYAKFLTKDGKLHEALKMAKDFIAIAKPDEFSFFESRTAYKNLNEFVRTKVLPKKD